MIWLIATGLVAITISAIAVLASYALMRVSSGRRLRLSSISIAIFPALILNYLAVRYLHDVFDWSVVGGAMNLGIAIIVTFIAVPAWSFVAQKHFGSGEQMQAEVSIDG